MSELAHMSDHGSVFPSLLPLPTPAVQQRWWRPRPLVLPILAAPHHGVALVVVEVEVAVLGLVLLVRLLRYVSTATNPRRALLSRING